MNTVFTFLLTLTASAAVLAVDVMGARTLFF